MPQTFSKLLYHVIFSTKNRAPLIVPSIQEDLYRRMHQLSEVKGCRILEIGGMEDHVHLLLETRPRFCLSAVVQQVKGASSKWLQERGKAPGDSFWQTGYGIFSVSESGLDQVRRYIRNQETHHRERTSRDEFMLLLRRHHIPFDPSPSR